MTKLLKRYWYFWSVLLLIGLLLFWRQSHINQVPYIDDPYDVAAFRDEMRDRMMEGNAYEEYHEAWKLFRIWTSVEEIEQWNSIWDTDGGAKQLGPILDWKLANQAADDVLNNSQEPLSYWLAGVEKPFRQQNLPHLNQLLVKDGQEKIDFSDYRIVRTDDLLRLSLLQASRLRSEQDYAKAWMYHFAAVRYLFQPTFNARDPASADEIEMVQLALEAYLAEPVLTEEMLLRIQRDLASWTIVDQPVSEEIKMSYLPDYHFFSEYSNGVSKAFRSSDPKYWWAWGDQLCGNVEWRHRCIKLNYQNILRFCDLSESTKPASVKNRFSNFIYQTQGEPDDLAISSTDLVTLWGKCETVYSPWGSWLLFEHVFTEHKAKQTFRECLLVLIALQRYQRQHGDYPEALQDLIPRYISEIPEDRFAPGTSLRYRVENGDARIWSVGPDTVDDQAKVSYKELGISGSGPGDLIYRAWQPGTDLSLVQDQAQVEKLEQQVEVEGSEK